MEMLHIPRTPNKTYLGATQRTRGTLKGWWTEFLLGQIWPKFFGSANKSLPGLKAVSCVSSPQFHVALLSQKEPRKDWIQSRAWRRCLGRRCFPAAGCWPWAVIGLLPARRSLPRLSLGSHGWDDEGDLSHLYPFSHVGDYEVDMATRKLWYII